MTERIDLGRTNHLANFRKMAALSHDHNAIMLAVIVVVFQQRANVVDIDVPLRNQNHVRSAGHA